jgi:hypothetical protein
MIEIIRSCYSVDCNIFCQLFIISFEFKERINETPKFEELFNKFAHNLEIYSLKLLYTLCTTYIIQMHYY